MKQIIKPVSKKLLKSELKPEYFLRETNRAGNEIYVITAAQAPNVMREIGRLREWAFRSAGGGTGQEVDIDELDLVEGGYRQLVVWDPAAEEIVGGYRFIVCESEDECHLSTEHYFRFSEEFRKEY
ncbi:MAG: GNAT family N-acetyltransferase, partial [Tidjanibacter sp.]|nr:GNAT family N-acetyltransferase [Tidjanibacter sp.]